MIILDNDWSIRDYKSRKRSALVHNQCFYCEEPETAYAHDASLDHSTIGRHKYHVNGVAECFRCYEKVPSTILKKAIFLNVKL